MLVSVLNLIFFIYFVGGGQCFSETFFVQIAIQLHRQEQHIHAIFVPLITMVGDHEVTFSMQWIWFMREERKTTRLQEKKKIPQFYKNKPSPESFTR